MSLKIKKNSIAKPSVFSKTHALKCGVNIDDGVNVDELFDEVLLSEGCGTKTQLCECGAIKVTISTTKLHLFPATYQRFFPVFENAQRKLSHVKRFKTMPKSNLVIGVLFWGVFSCQLQPPFEEIPEFSGTIVLIKEQLISGGAIFATLAVTPPDKEISFPLENDVPLPGGNEVPTESADLHLSLQVRYKTEGILGSQSANDFVPYLIVRATIENLDSGENFIRFLVPEISLSEGFHYGRNLSVFDNLGFSEAGYLVKIQIIPPALASDVSALLPDASISEQQRGRSALSPGIVFAQSLVPFLRGSVFSVADISSRQLAIINLAGAFTLSDFIEVDQSDSEQVGSGQVPGYYQ